MEDNLQTNQETGNGNNENSLEVKRQEVIKLRAEYLATQELITEKQKKFTELRQFAEKHNVYIESLAERRDNLNATNRDQRKKVQETQNYLAYITSQLKKNEEAVAEVRKEVGKAKRNAQPVFSAYNIAHNELLKVEQMFKEVSQKLREAQMEYQLKGGALSPQETIKVPLPPKSSLESEAEIKSNPWVSGSFYVFAIVTVMTVLAVISSWLPWYSVGIVFASGLLAVSIIGALQLRNDKKLSETNFVKLMGEAMKQLPSLLSASKEKDESQ